MIDRIRLPLYLLRVLLLHKLREKQTLFGLLLLPLIAFLMIGFYKILLEGAWQVVPRSLAPTLAVVLVDPGGPLPDPAIAV
ncbi:MAG: hypothetical protein RLY86_1468, partial [Pseudomonadota bacterium]